MQVHIITPYSIAKDLGRAYNEACQLIPDGDYICLMDYDCMLLTPDAGAILHKYAEQAAEECLMTCYTNRCHETSLQHVAIMNNVTDIKEHIRFAESKRGTELLKIKGNISGFLMLLPKSLWIKYPFKEGIGCLGVDTDYWRRLASDNVPIYIMPGLYVFHIYRLTTNSKSHLI